MIATDLIPVRVSDCRCPGAPHADGDFVSLRPKLDLGQGIVMQQPIIDWLRTPQADRPPQEFMRAEIAARYLTLGIAEWNLEDEKGPLAVDPLTIRARLLSDFDLAEPVADKADDLYAEVALGPLRKLESRSSPPTSSNGSTSPTRSGSPKSRKPRK